MRKDNLFVYIVGFLILAIFLYGVVSLLILRYEAGDIYPPYSSLRADPLGVKALYEGLAEVEGLTASRAYKSATKLREQRKTTLLYVGLQPSQFRWVEKDIVQALEELLFHGNRVVLTFSPVYEQPSAFSFFQRVDELEEETIEEDELEKTRDEDVEPDETGSAETKEEETPDADREKQEPDSRMPAPVVALHDRWDVGFKYTKLSKNDKNVYESISAANQSGQALPETISWHTSLYFDISDRKDDWKVIYTAARKPVIIEKTWGQGTLVLCADSYFLSNEAMRNERHPELLAWLVGPNTTVIFDETHFGVMESPGVASLLRKYRLMWFVAALFMLAILFVWKNAVSFVPPHDAALTAEERSEKDIMTGLVNLLRQNIPSRDILSTCFDEWNKSFSHRHKELGNTLEQIQATVKAEQARPARERNPVAVYKTISRMLRERG